MMVRVVDGFTLIEFAIAIFLIGLLTASILMPLATQVNQRKIAEAQLRLHEVREALIGFSVARGYLPCPAISATDGREDRTAGVCTGGKRQGFLPWVTLELPKLDPWGNIYRYGVTPAYTSSAALFGLGTAPDITIRTRTADGSALTNLTNANTVTAVVLAHGNNGYGAFNDQGVAQGLPADWPASNADENTNATGTTQFIERPHQALGAGGAGGEFDDIVAWLPRSSLVNRMVAAGTLP